MTREEINELKLGMIIDDRAVIIINSALEWLSTNTIISTEKITPSIKLFLIKYTELYEMNNTIASESAEGLSHSYKNISQNAVWEIAQGLFGSEVRNGVKFFQARARWE